MLLIYVQHLLGIGHLRRVSFLAVAMANHQFDVHIVTGGMPVTDLTVTNFQLHQLPPLSASNGFFNELVNEKGLPIDQHWKDQRCKALLDLFNFIGPDVLITETFPFGRRMMRFELIPLLQQAKKKKPNLLIISSIRDILQPKHKQQRNVEILDLIEQFYDKVLVHGDNSITPLETTFPDTKKIAHKVNYTGYVIDPFALDSTQAFTKRDEVLVSGGGGAASLPLLKTAIEARPQSNFKGHTWRLLVGHNIDRATFNSLQQHSNSGMIIERNRSDFYSLLKSCSVSVSQAGYNTVMDVLKANAHSVLVPYAKSGELEQTIRANQLQKQNRVVCLEQSMLNPRNLAFAIDTAAMRPIKAKQYQMNGANKTAELIKSWLN